MSRRLVILVATTALAVIGLVAWPVAAGNAELPDRSTVVWDIPNQQHR